MFEPISTIITGPSGPVKVAFGEATAKQHPGCFKLCGDAFRSPLSEMDYLDREKQLSPELLKDDDSIRLWCIYLEDEPSKVLAAGRTIYREFLNHDVNGTREERGYCLASVVTDPQYRSCGLASHLLAHIAQWMDTPGKAAASMLYSSIGDFYVRKGWKKHNRAQSTLMTKTHQAKSVEGPHLASTRGLGQPEVEGLATIDIQDIKKSFENSLVSAGEVRVLILPTASIITRLHNQATFVSSKLHGRTPEHYGSICHEKGVWTYWYHDFRKQQLGIQRIRVPLEWNDSQVEPVAQLLLDALDEASRWLLPKVVIWEPHECTRRAMELLSENFQVNVENEGQVTKSVASVRWRNADESRKILLELNEFYAWS